MTSSSNKPPVIVWFRQDLRCSDNPALAAAAGEGRPVIAVFILDDMTPGEWRLGGASRWWLHHSLTGLASELARRGNRLILRRGAAAKVLLSMIADTGATSVHWNRCYEPFAIARDTKIKEALKNSSVSVTSHAGSLLFEPWTIRTGSGGPYKVFTPFYRACLQAPAPRIPLPAPDSLPAPTEPLSSDRLADWSLLPSAPDWAGGLRQNWSPGETGAQERLTAFLDNTVGVYPAARDIPGTKGTSRLSPHLHWGEISPHQIWHAAATRAEDLAESGAQDKGRESFLREVIWREFSYNLLFHWPDLPDSPLRQEFLNFPWHRDSSRERAWQTGMTGYPIVDAGMRELWHTGWMHNRVRMIAASFLIKDLNVPWQAGETWFWDTLVDADLANNAASWQWVAGCGADAAPYFRVFNPVTQGRKFDPDGVYVRRWIPEIAALPDKYLHAPWEAPAQVLTDAAIALGDHYPRPIVDHAIARQRTLEAYNDIKSGVAGK